MRRWHNRIVVFGITVISMLPAMAKEEKVALDQVPAKLTATVKARWPKAEIQAIEREEQDGKVIYEFGLKEGKRKLDVSFSADGALVAVEEVIPDKDVPAPVKAAVAKKYAAAKVLLIERVTEGEGKAAKTFYEYKIKTEQGGIEAKFDADGKLLNEEQKKGDEINE